MAREALQIERGMTREIAEAHWHFIEVGERIDNEDGLVSLEKAGYWYVEAMLHGAKHERKVTS